MAIGYMYEEALGFVTEHFRLYPVPARILWDMEEAPEDISEVLEGRGREVHWEDEELKQLHDFLIRHSKVTDPLLR